MRSTDRTQADRRQLLLLLGAAVVMLLVGVRLAVELGERRDSPGRSLASLAGTDGRHAAIDERGAWLLARLPACPLHRLTGIACPTCGGTRAVVSLSDGHIGQALGWNPLVTLGAIGVVLLAGTAGVAPRIADRGVAWVRRLMHRRRWRGILIAAVLVQCLALTWKGL